MRFNPGEVAQGHAGFRILKRLIDALTMGVAVYQHDLAGEVSRLRDQLFKKLPISRRRVAGICCLEARISLNDDQDARQLHGACQRK
jgi:hypothetical protein